MGSLVRFLCACALTVVFGVGCDFCVTDADCEDDNYCTVDSCELGSCRHDRGSRAFFQCNALDDPDAVCNPWRGMCVEPSGECTMADFAFLEAEGRFPVGLDGCYEAWVDASGGSEADCVDSVTDCCFQNSDGALTRDCSGCVASGYCCKQLRCEDPPRRCSSCEEGMDDCMFGVQP